MQAQFLDNDYIFKPKTMCSMWLHTAFIKQPPPNMGGKSHALTAEEAQEEKLPEGTWKVSGLRG